MTSRSRKTLSLLKSAEAGREIVDVGFDVTVYDVLLPCRRFVVDHKVAEAGAVSLTSEFLLRLLKSMDGIAETMLSDFFGYNDREVNFVISESERPGYIERRAGRLWLTEAGHKLFRDGTEEPQIYEVEKRSTKIGLDLLSFSPAERESLSRFDLCLPELKSISNDRVANASGIVPEKFRRFYGEFKNRDSAKGKKQSLYSIDHVQPADRYSTPVRVVAKATASKPGFPEPNLESWRVGYELDDRAEVVEAAARFLDDKRVLRHPTDKTALDLLTELAPEFLKEYTRRDGLSVERYFNEAVSRAGEIRSDRMTVPILGTLFTSGNVERVIEAIGYASRSKISAPKISLWKIPNAYLWGATRILPSILQTVQRQITVEHDSSQTDFHNIGICAGNPERYIREAFDTVITEGRASSMPQLEIFLVPGRIVAVLAHTLLTGQHAIATPLGFLSFDPLVVRRGQKVLLDELPSTFTVAGALNAVDVKTLIAQIEEDEIPETSST